MNFNGLTLDVYSRLKTAKQIDAICHIDYDMSIFDTFVFPLLLKKNRKLWIEIPRLYVHTQLSWEFEQQNTTIAHTIKRTYVPETGIKGRDK